MACVAEQLVDLGEAEDGVDDEDGGGPEPSSARLAIAAEIGGREKDREEQQDEKQRNLESRAPAVELEAPREVVAGGPDKCGEREWIPSAPHGEEPGGNAEQREIAEEEDLVVLAGGDECRRGETSEERHRRNDLRILSYRDDERCRRHHEHRRECHVGGRQMVEIERCPKRQINGAERDGF